MYFTSSTWSLVGCLVAGFGVYPLLQPCINPSLSDDVLSKNYAERLLFMRSYKRHCICDIC